MGHLSPLQTTLIEHTMSSSNEPSKARGQAKSLEGTATEIVGNVLGSKNWQTSGQKTHAEGEAETKAAETQGYVEGTIDRVTGKIDNVFGAIAGDTAKQAKGGAREEKGKLQQDLNSSS